MKILIKPISYEISMADKAHLNMIITGHIDNGKSTTMGHFLMDLGVVDERAIAQHAEESEKTGKVTLSNTLGSWIISKTNEKEESQ